MGGQPAEHSIDLRLRVSVEPGDHPDRVKDLVLSKAAKILRSVKGALERTSGEVAKAAPVQDEAHDPAEAGPADSQDRGEGLPTLPPG
ncbi:MAG: hypothetical protein KME20_23300 [Kaiparowitsia implicata GSE-PSE-MK54-09C]|nr:hypothetical protein [Kaiparowitsia implicata GSE-PSE-MK54-09C]